MNIDRNWDDANKPRNIKEEKAGKTWRTGSRSQTSGGTNPANTWFQTSLVYRIMKNKFLLFKLFFSLKFVVLLFGSIFGRI